MMYKKMIEDAKAKGLTSDKGNGGKVQTSWMCVVKKEDPDKYWKFIQKAAWNHVTNT